MAPSTRSPGAQLIRALADNWSSGRTTEHNYYDVISTCFDVCEALYWIDPNSVPAAWQYSPGMGCPGPSEGDVKAYAYGLHSYVADEAQASLEILVDLGVNVAETLNGWAGEGLSAVYRAEAALIYAGNVITRYADLIRPDGE